VTHHLRTAVAVACTLGVTGALAVACVEAPPALPALASKPLSIRLHVFGADAEDAHDAVVSLKRNNPNFAVVQDGGDGDVLIGIEKDSAQCVEPTAHCSYRISYRVRRAGGEVVLARDETILADSDSCSRLCDKALNKVAVKAVEDAADALRDAPAAAPSASAASPAGSASAGPGTRPPPGSSARPEPGARPGASAKTPAGDAPADAAAAPATGICSVAVGPPLPAKEAERRVAQVDALKRLGVIDEAEFDCLRTAYLERL
jgi:hypothetical protein